MKKLVISATALLVTSTGYSTVDPNYVLPENGKIQVATITGSYSCKEAGKFKALNLNGETHNEGNYYPELQINFSCGSTPEIEGSDLTTIAEIGNRSLEELDFYTTLTPVWKSGQSYEFKRALPIKENTTYSAILNTFKYRGLMAFRVLSYQKNVLTIQYVTRKYSLINETAKSDFIEYEKKNSF